MSYECVTSKYLPLSGSDQGGVTVTGHKHHLLSHSCLEAIQSLQSTLLYVLGLWEETTVHGESPCTHRENMQTPPRNGLDANQRPSLL